MKRFAKILIWIILITGIIAFAELFVLRKNITPPATKPQNKVSNQHPAETAPVADPAAPETAPADNPSPSSAAVAAPAPDSLPEKSLLDMPFYSQAPLGKWDAVHENTCEEASVLNGGLFLLGKKITLAEFDNEMMKMIGLEKKLNINFNDSTIAETKQFTDSYFSGNIQSKIIDNPSVEDIETEIAAGHPVIVPLAGRDIGNPNFTPPGPIYHMLVLKGYDSQNFITNDVGTRKGDSYTYKKSVIIQNMHDWNAKDIHLGTKKVLVLYR